VTLHGADFLSGAVVNFGNKAARVLHISADGTHIMVRTPAHDNGLVKISISNPDGMVTTLAGGFFYINPMTR
jgi:hypothetical protein